MPENEVIGHEITVKVT
ncbi:hypothetical protein [Bacillus amyloliquefaciens]